MDRENSEVKMEMPTRGAKMSKEARKAAVFSCEYSEQNPVYCQQCGGHEHLCRKRLNTEGLTAYFDQMATDGRVETTVQWLVEISLLIQSDVEKRLKHVHAEHSTAIRKVAQKLFERQHSTIDPQLLELCENDEEREILATKNRDGLFTRFLITRAKGDAWPKTPCSKCGHRFHEKECHTSLVSSRGSVACDCAGYDHAAAELRWIPVSERLPENGKAHYLTIEEDGKRSVIKGFWHQRSGRWCGITETTEVGYKLPVTQTVIAWQIIPEKIIIEPYAEPADNIGEGV